MNYILWASLWLNCAFVGYNLIRHVTTHFEKRSWDYDDFISCGFFSLFLAPIVVVMGVTTYIECVWKKLYS